MPPRVGQRAMPKDMPNRPTQPPRPTTPDASTGPKPPVALPAKAGPPKAREELQKSMPESQKNASPWRARVSDLNDPDRDE